MSDFKAQTPTIGGNAVSMIRYPTTLRTLTIDGIVGKAPPGVLIVGSLNVNGLTDTEHFGNWRSLEVYVLRVYPPGVDTEADLHMINNVSEGDWVTIEAPIGRIVNVKHALGNIYLANGNISDTFQIEGPNSRLRLYHNSVGLVEVSRTVIPVGV